MALFGHCKRDSPAEQCYSCQVNLTVSRPSGIENSTDAQTVCSESAANDFQKRYTYRDSTAATRTRIVSVATCRLIQ